MDIKKEAVREYLEDGIPYRALAKKYGVSRSTINQWVLVHRGIHDIPRSHKQVSYDLQQQKLGKNLSKRYSNFRVIWRKKWRYWTGNKWTHTLFLISPLIIASILVLIVICQSLTTSLSAWDGAAIILAVPFLLFMISMDLLLKRLLRKKILYLWLIELFILASIFSFWRIVYLG